MLDSAIGAGAGFAIFALVRWLYRRLRGREGLGLGDAKLLAAAGAWVTWNGLPSVVLIAAVFGLVSALVMAQRGEQLSLNQRLAFGPALCLGTWLVWLYGPIAGS
jgi:leader peptidase (prepilin peptidase)/N-methyltransferase